MIGGRLVYDVFSFFNELDVLELRLRVLNDIVDRFVVVQGLETHAGDEKPMYFAPDDPRWAPWAARLSTLTVPRIPDAANRWVREREMRHVKTRALEEAGARDLVILSCVDEIPDPRALREVADDLSTERWVGFLTACYYYYLNLRTSRLFPCIQFAQVDTVRRIGPDALETLGYKKRSPIAPIPAGWHFSYMGGVEAIQAKLAAFAHAEYDTPWHKDAAWLAECLAQRKPLFGARYRERYRIVPLSELPDEVSRSRDRYAHLLLPEEGA